MMMCSGVPDVVELVLVLVLQCVQLTPSNNINSTSQRCMTTQLQLWTNMIMCVRMCEIHFQFLSICTIHVLHDVLASKRL